MPINNDVAVSPYWFDKKKFFVARGLSGVPTRACSTPEEAIEAAKHIEEEFKAKSLSIATPLPEDWAPEGLKKFKAAERSINTRIPKGYSVWRVSPESSWEGFIAADENGLLAGEFLSEDDAVKFISDLDFGREPRR